MNSPTQQPLVQHPGPGLGFATGEETLRLIARLPAPMGLEERVKASLRSAPPRARILHWPVAPRLNSAWMRTAAAAAIVFVVAGGGWGVYSRVGTARNVAVPQIGASQGGFSSSGAMRTPQTLNGPVVTPPIAKEAAKSGTRAPQAAAHRPKTATSGKTAAPAAATQAK